MSPQKRGESKFVGDRLRLARAFKGQTQGELARSVGWSASRVSLAERGKATPSGMMVDAIAEVTKFERHFFFTPVEEWLDENRCSFRRLRSAPKRDRERVLARGTLLAILIQYLRSRLALPDFDIPDIPSRGPESAERAAEACRKYWDIAQDAPIARVGRVLEIAGVAWVKVDAYSRKIDAFSHSGNISLVFVNTAKDSTSRTVFDLAHELGHLVMHRNTIIELAERESDANRFASAFLLPREGFIREFPTTGRLVWKQLFTMKRRWRTSVAAIVRRAYDLELIGPAQYQRGYKYLYAKGWQRKEPFEPPQETPELIRLALNTLEEELGEGPGQLAKSLGWTPRVFTEVTGVPIDERLCGAPITDIREVYKNKGKEGDHG